MQSIRQSNVSNQLERSLGFNCPILEFQLNFLEERHGAAIRPNVGQGTLPSGVTQHDGPDAKRKSFPAEIRSKCDPTSTGAMKRTHHAWSTPRTSNREAQDSYDHECALLFVSSPAAATDAADPHSDQIQILCVLFA